MAAVMLRIAATWAGIGSPTRQAPVERKGVKRDNYN